MHSSSPNDSHPHEQTAMPWRVVAIRTPPRAHESHSLSPLLSTQDTLVPLPPPLSTTPPSLLSVNRGFGQALPQISRKGEKSQLHHKFTTYTGSVVTHNHVTTLAVHGGVLNVHGSLISRQSLFFLPFLCICRV